MMLKLGASDYDYAMTAASAGNHNEIIELIKNYAKR
jgi:hypothetical protein